MVKIQITIHMIQNSASSETWQWNHGLH